jgi:hypothetical protein
MRRLLFTITVLCFAGVASAQYRSGGNDKVYFGGGFGLSIGTDVTSISASPLVGYRITDPFSVGMQVTYQYVNNKNYDLAFNNYGVAPFARFQVDKYFAHAEFEHLNFEYATGFLTPDGDFETARDGYNSLWLGGGYTEGGFFILALYNVLYDETDQFQPYASPFTVRAGFSVGF